MGGRHYYLAKELAKLGYNVCVIASSSNHLLRKTFPATERFVREQVDGFTFVWVKMPSYSKAHSKQRMLNWILFPLRLQKLAKSTPEAPDVILCSSPSLFSFLGAQRLARRFKSRLVFEVRDIWPLTLIEVGGYSLKNPFIRLMQRVEDYAYSHSDHVISNLKYAINHMQSHGLRPERFTWIPNGFSLDEVNQQMPLDEALKNQLPPGKFIVGYTGTIGLANALDSLVTTATLLKDIPEISFVLVGDGSRKASLQKQVIEIGLKNVVFIDPVPKNQIQSMLACFDACFIGFVKAPLFRFGVSPNKLFDYFYAGKPILYAIESGEYHPVEAAGAGFELPAENSSAIADAILKLLAMRPDEREKMGQNGRNSALRDYEYGTLAKKMADVLLR